MAEESGGLEQIARQGLQSVCVGPSLAPDGAQRKGPLAMDDVSAPDAAQREGPLMDGA